MAASECTEEPRHHARRLAEIEIETQLIGYQVAHGLSAVDMAVLLTSITRSYLRYVDRDDEERRTGFRHRLAGECNRD